MKPGGKFSGLGDRARLLGIPTWEPANLQELGCVAADIMQRRPELVVIAGGDGTLRDVVSALHAAAGGAALPKLLFLPAGTVSTVVRNWGGVCGPIGATLERIGRREWPPTRERPTLAISLSDGRRLVGFMMGLGLVSRFFEEYQRHGSGGLGAAAKIASRVFVGVFTRSDYTQAMLDPMPCRLVVNGVEEPASAYSLLTCSVVRDLGLHFIVNHRAGEHCYRPHLVACPLPAFQLGRQAFRVLRGQALLAPQGYDGLISSGEIRFERTTPIMIDGDLFAVESVAVTAGPVLNVCS